MLRPVVSSGSAVLLNRTDCTCGSGLITLTAIPIVNAPHADGRHRDIQDRVAEGLGTLSTAVYVFSDTHAHMHQ